MFTYQYDFNRIPVIVGAVNTWTNTPLELSAYTLIETWHYLSLLVQRTPKEIIRASVTRHLLHHHKRSLLHPRVRITMLQGRLGLAVQPNLFRRQQPTRESLNPG